MANVNPPLPASWAGCKPLQKPNGQVDGRAIMVFMKKGVVPKTATEMNQTHHVQREWRTLQERFGPGPINLDRAFELAVELNHGYHGTPDSHQRVVDLVHVYGADANPLRAYYDHCRSIQRDVSGMAEEDLDYQDLFCDAGRSKLFIQKEEEGVCLQYTLANAADCIRRHPRLMPTTWNANQAARDAMRIWEQAESDVAQFLTMLQNDGPNP
jgi:hypothetical protein